MKLIKKILIGCMLFSSIVSAQTYTQDTGKVTTLFVNSAGAMSIQLDNGVPNAFSQYSCNSGANGFIGDANLNQEMKATLLATKAAQQTIRVIVTGCHEGWFKLSEIYVL